jgi:hypothetical protein
MKITKRYKYCAARISLVSATVAIAQISNINS